MNKRIKTLIVCFLLIASYLVIIYPINAIKISGNTLYVGGCGAGNYSSIQDAINDSSSGDIIFVFNGLYTINEMIWITFKDNLRFIGEDKDSTIIEFQGEHDLFFILQSNHIFFDRFSFIGNSNNSIFTLRDASYITITNSIFKNLLHMIFISDVDMASNNIIILDNFFQNSYCAISISGTYTLYNFLISRNIFIKNYLAIETYNFNNSQISGNFILNNTNGMYIGKSENCLLFENVIENNTVDGLSFFDCKNISLNNNTINDNENGICIHKNSNNNTISNNNIISNQRFGIYFDQSQNNIVKNNNFIGNKINSYFYKCNRNNIWDSNYWGKPKIIPKFIFGSIKLMNITFPWLNFDWHPAKESFDIL